MRNTFFTHFMAGIGVFGVGTYIYRLADNPGWILLWVLAAFWIGYIIGQERTDDR